MGVVVVGGGGGGGKKGQGGEVDSIVAMRAWAWLMYRPNKNRTIVNYHNPHARLVSHESRDRGSVTFQLCHI